MVCCVTTSASMLCGGSGVLENHPKRRIALKSIPCGSPIIYPRDRLPPRLFSPSQNEFNIARRQRVSQAVMRHMRDGKRFEQAWDEYVISNHLTASEQALFERLPGPPVAGGVRTNKVWIIEWLPPNEQLTGQLLHDWMKDRRPGWSAYFPCKNKVTVLAAIEQATAYAKKSGMTPVLHIEAHGDKDENGLVGPDDNGRSELLAWHELTNPLQQLNLVTHCNLVVVVAACTGFAGIKAFDHGPLAVAAALVGPLVPLSPRQLLLGAKEFYRRWMDENPNLTDIVASASREASTEAEVVTFEYEPFVIFAYEAMIEPLIISMRPDERRKRIERLRSRLLTETGLSTAEVMHRSMRLPPLPFPADLQKMWDERFMIDLFPENRDRFGVDMAAIIEMIAGQPGDRSQSQGDVT